MNILHLRASNFYGGPERQLHFHAKKSKGTDTNITISSFSENNQTPEFLDIIARDNINVHTFMVKGSFDKKVISDLRDYLSKNKIDILCTHEYKSHFIAWRATKKLSTKWLAFSRGWTSESFKIKLYHWLDKIIIRFADHIIAVSESQRKKLGKLFISKNKITTVHNAIDTDAFSDIIPVDLKSKFELPKESIIGISGGRFSEEKGQVDLVFAAEQVLMRFDSLYFILFGDGPDLDIVKAIIKKKNLEDRILCPGYEKNLLGCLKGADFLVNPSLSEGLPNIILEAAVMKTPVVATDVGGVGEILTDKENGLLVKANSPDKMANAIMELIGQPEASEPYVEKAYLTVKDKFTFDSQYEKLNMIYNKLLA